MTSDPLDRLISLVRRELGADDVRVLEGPAPAVAAPNVIHADLADGRKLAVAFAAAPPAREALVRRLHMLVLTFAQSLEDDPSIRREPRASAVQSLREELRALAARARGVDAVVIDANSPVVWGSATAEPAVRHDLGNVELVDVSRHQLAPASRATEGDPFRDDDESPDPPLAATPSLTARAIDVVRALPGLADIHKGRHLNHAERDPSFGCVARSFAGIYLLIVVYDGPFDELRAERSIADGLPRIERLVLALPPLDPKPAPKAGVMSLRRPRRR
jgi:hypothetical protein